MMNRISATYEWLEMMTELQLNLIGVRVRDDRGTVATETAVVMAVLIAVAVALGGIFLVKATSNANQIPDSVPAPG